MADVSRHSGAGGDRRAPTAGPDDAGGAGRGRALWKLGLLALIVVGGVLLARYTPVGTYLSRDGIQRGLEMIRGNPWAPLLFVLTYGVAMALALPGSALTLAGGALFGLGWGVVFNTLGANLGANAAFLLGRWLGRDGVERLAGDRLEKLDRATREYGFRGLFTLRLIPVVPFNALNFGSGLTSISWGAYAGATALGILPGTVVYTMFADALLQGSREASREALTRVLVSAALLILLSLLPTIVKKMNVKLPGGRAGLLALLLAGATAAAGLPGTPAAARTATAPGVARAGSVEGPMSARHGAIPDHAGFTAVLADHVRDGRVDYEDLNERRGRLDAYLERLAATDPAALEDAGQDVRLAFWINAYNACMLKRVLDHYPLTGERPGLLDRLKNAVTDRPANSVWQIEDVFTEAHCRVAGALRSQDQIEHEIIRPIGDPRIHFAVNCAALSCPVLAAEAYVPGALDRQLDRQVERFVADPDHFRLEEGSPPVLTVNRVLDWYGEDFGGPQGLKRFFADHLEGERRSLVRNPDTVVRYFEYDWTLNDAER